jgi:hypothetical protein
MVTRDGSGGIRERLTQPILAVLAVYLYVFMEWLFFVTKPSFMSVLGPFESVRVLLAAPLPLAAAAVAAVLVLWMPMVFTRRRAAGAVASAAARFVPSALLAGAMILLIDNFTYTIFKFGVRTTHGWLVHLYAVLAVILLVVSFLLVGALERRLGRPAAFRTAVVATPGLVLLSVLAV